MINNFGCGYVAAINRIFRFFEGKEKEFMDTFGYPMYTVCDGKIDFNYEISILKFFNYSVLEKTYLPEIILSSISKDLYEERLKVYINSEEYKRKLPDDFTNWQAEEWENWYRFDASRKAKWQKLYSAYEKAKNKYIDFGIEVNPTFGFFDDFLKEYGINSNILHITNPSPYKVDDIIASDGFDLYYMSGNLYEENVPNHYIYITEIKVSGQTFVSSWGKKYSFDDNNSRYTEKILIRKGI